MSDNASLAFACACGTVRGAVHRVSPREGDRVVCHCSDCQDFARYCDAEDRILGEYRGTSLYQSRCARVEIGAGREHLACLHLTDKPTLRWYASCCSTPMFNSYASGRIPYITTLLANCETKRADALLGPPLGHLFLEDVPGAPGTLPRLSMARLMRRFFVRMVQDYVSGKRRQSPLFDPKTLDPIAPPHRLTQTEREAKGLHSPKEASINA